MRTVPARCRHRRLVVVPALAAATALALAPGMPAGADTVSPSSTAKAGPGMGAPHPCAPAVAYSLGGPTIAPRPLPAVASSVGGDRLAAAGLQVTGSARSKPPAPRATAWVVADLDTGRVLAACNAHAPLAPASTLKVLTALALAPRLEPDATYVARPEDAAVDGTKVGLVPGSVYTARDLWHALLMSSANDAATGLAAMAGGTDAATATMLETARSLGAGDTVARNTSGLDEPGQVSSAYDLVLFGRAALTDPVITAYFQTRSYTFPGPGTAVGAPGRTTFQIQNHNRLLFNYPGALGVKNGWTSTTGGSFIGAAERGGRRIGVSVLAADPQTWRMSAALLDWAFTATTAQSEGVGQLVAGPRPAPPARPGAVVESVTEVAGPARDSGGFGFEDVLALGLGMAALVAAAGLNIRNRRGVAVTGAPAQRVVDIRSPGVLPAAVGRPDESSDDDGPSRSDDSWRRRRSW